ncbi:MAG TPA: tRNA pseudouridine(55) synthase TruB [Aquifex sp.]|nr:tRNA pseudouridine(55) synthase TruB [Aquifex sp.]
MEELFGLLAVAKPKGITSTGVLNEIKRHFGVRRIGHTGTLDPFAEGLLLLLLGRATRLAEYYQRLPKTYRAVGLLGVETDTYDITGEVISRREAAAFPPLEEIERVVKSFEGEIEQTPPPFSAKKVGGKRAYKLARKGKRVELKPVKVKVYKIDLLEYNPPRFTIGATVSGGTYIRSLVKDIGDKLGLGATTEKLLRTSIGKLTLENALPLEELLKVSPERLSDFLLPPDAGLDFPTLEVSDRELTRLRNGQLIDLKGDFGENQLLRVYAGGKFSAIGRVVGGKLKPEKVFV